MMIIDNLVQMNSPRPHGQKTTRFASNNQVFNYTVETSNQDDSLLLTPTQQEVNRMRNSIGSKATKQIVQQNEDEKKLKEQMDAFNRQAKRKRQMFKMRFTNAAISEPKDPQQNKVSIEQNQLVAHEGPEKMNIESSEEQPTKETNAIKHISDIRSQASKNSQKYSYNKQEDFSESKRRQNQQESRESRKEERRERPRVTMDLKSLFGGNFLPFSQNQSKSFGKSSLSEVKEQQFNSKYTDDRLSFGKKSKSKRLSCVSRAIQRMSGEVKMQERKNRLTVGIQGILSMLENNEVKKQERVEHLESIREAMEYKQKLKENPEDVKIRQSIQQYFEQNNLRYLQMGHKIQYHDQKKKKLEQLFKQKIQIIQILAERTQRNQRQKQEIEKQTSDYLKKIPSNEDMKTMMSPFLYLEQRYNIKLLKLQIDTQSAFKSYTMDLVLDKEIYCRFKRIESNQAVIQVRESVVWRNISPQWIMNIQLRIELIVKFATNNVQILEPLELLMSIGELYEKIQDIESDIQAIENNFGAKDLSFNPISKKLTFVIDEIMRDITLKVTINFMNLYKEDFFEIEIYRRTNWNYQGSSLILKDDGRSNTLTGFINECLQKVQF